MSKRDAAFSALWVALGLYIALWSTLTPWLGVGFIAVGLGYMVMAISPRARQLLGPRQK